MKRFVGIVDMAQHTPADGVHHYRPMPSQKPCEGIAVALGNEAFDQNGIGRADENSGSRQATTQIDKRCIE